MQIIPEKTKTEFPLGETPLFQNYADIILSEKENINRKFIFSNFSEQPGPQGLGFLTHRKLRPMS